MMIFNYINSYRKKHSVNKMARVFKISKSGFYRWNKGKKCKRKLINEIIVKKIREIQEKVKYRYGKNRILRKLKEVFHFKLNHKRISNLLRANKLNARRRKKYKVTTNSSHKKICSPNLLKRNFYAAKPNKVWVSDITYFWTKEGWIYLCVIIDLFSRKVIGWTVDKRMKAELVIRSVWKAIKIRVPEPGLIFHSDRGSQYCSTKLRNIFKEYKITQSMSKKGDCWDNACAESFFGTLKNELSHDIIFKNIEEARNELFEFIEIYYNRERLHSYLDYQSPLDFEEKNIVA